MEMRRYSWAPMYHILTNYKRIQALRTTAIGGERPASAGWCLSPLAGGRRLFALHLLRHDERNAIRPAEQLISRFVIAEGFRRGVECQASADAVGDVTQMAKASAFVPLLDVGVGPLVLADAVEKVAQVRSLDLRRLIRRLDAVVDVPALLINDERAVLAV